MSTIPKKKLRDAKTYQDLSRWPLLNHLRTEKSILEEKKPGHNIWDFVSESIFKWIYHYIKSRFGKNHEYVDYQDPQNGIYTFDNSVAQTDIAIAADWATNTKESIWIAGEINKKAADYTIHMGDTYFVGEPKEITANFLPETDSIWPRGAKGSFALLGNHEMYANGTSYFRDLLPCMGMRLPDGKFSGQTASFFCFQNEHWRILGLDTGYHSIGKIPILEKIPWFAPDCHFDKVLIDWLTKTVRLSDPNDKRGLVILTHHQYISAFKGEGEYIVPAEQLAELIGKDRPIIWIFGHEHKFAIYEKAQIKNGISAYCRCIGNGGMPIELKKDFEKSSGKQGYNKLVFVDKRERIPDLGYNGYALLKLKENRLGIEYYDINKLLISEEWSVNNGILSGNITVPEKNELMKGFEKQNGKQWSDAVK